MILTVDQIIQFAQKKYKTERIDIEPIFVQQNGENADLVIEDLRETRRLVYVVQGVVTCDYNPDIHSMPNGSPIIQCALNLYGTFSNSVTAYIQDPAEYYTESKEFRDTFIDVIMKKGAWNYGYYGYLLQAY